MSKKSFKMSIKKIFYYIRRIRWLWNHRSMKDCNRKFRLMEYDIRLNIDKKKKENTDDRMA